MQSMKSEAFLRRAASLFFKIKYVFELFIARAQPKKTRWQGQQLETWSRRIRFNPQIQTLKPQKSSKEWWQNSESVKRLLLEKGYKEHI
jgi:hypothetical protein